MLNLKEYWCIIHETIKTMSIGASRRSCFVKSALVGYCLTVGLTGGLTGVKPTVKFSAGSMATGPLSCYRHPGAMTLSQP